MPKNAAGPVPPSLRGVPVIWLAAALFAAITGYGVLNDGLHSDDWRHLAGVSPLWTAVEGRWLLEVIYRDLLGERFLLPVQLILAFPCLYWVALTLARHAGATDSEAAPGWAVLGIFAIGTQHVFMSDMLSFASNVFAYPLALALSVAGFELIARSAGTGRLLQIGSVLVAAQALAFSISIYQTYAVMGLILPVLALLRPDRVGFGAACRLALLGAVASVLALGLYLAEWRLYAAATGVTIASDRFQTADAAAFAAKLHDLPGLLRSLHTGTIMALPFAVRAALGLFSLGALVLLALAGLSGILAGRRGAWLAAARLGLGGGLAFFVFPILFWLGYVGDAPPPRAFGFIGFWTAAVFVAGLTLTAGLLHGGAGRFLLRAGMTATAGTGLVLTLTSAMIWSDNARVGARDIELARTIYARLATLPGYAGPPFRIVGSADRRDLSWGAFAGWSSFHAGNPKMGIFRQMFGMKEETVDLPVSPRACHAFPAADAAYMHEGTAYVCLNDFAPYPAELRCTSLPAPDGGQFCLAPNAMIHTGRTCLATGPEAPALLVRFLVPGPVQLPARSFSAENFTVPMAGACHTVVLAPVIKNLDRLELRLVAPDGAEIWRKEARPDELSPP